jgi:peptidyl-prolyl cis-trans isomerase SurA
MSDTKKAPTSQFHRHIVSLLALGAAGFTAACGSTPGTSAVTVTADTWAVVDGRAITKDDVDKAYRRLQDPSQVVSDEEALTAKLSLLNDFIVQDILLAKARALKVNVADSEVDTAYGKAKENMTDEAFQQELTKRGLTAADMREGLRRELQAQKVIDQEVGSKIAAITDKEVSDYFLANRSQFNIAEEAYQIAQIVVTPVREPPGTSGAADDATTPQAAAAKVQMLMERLKGGTPFHDLARQYSEDPETAPRGGDLGFVPVSRVKQTAPSLRNAVLDKPPGTATVATVDGAHTIVLVLAREQPGQRDLSTPGVRDRITQTLRSRKEQLLRAAYLTNLREDADVVNYLARRLVEAKGEMPSLPLAGPGKK